MSATKRSYFFISSYIFKVFLIPKVGTHAKSPTLLTNLCVTTRASQSLIAQHILTERRAELLYKLANRLQVFLRTSAHRFLLLKIAVF